MASAKEFREYADECFNWAETAKSNREREIFLQMVRAWMEAAVKAEGRWLPSSETGARPSANPSTLDAE
jgi:hypothetical protein